VKKVTTGRVRVTKRRAVNPAGQGGTSGRASGLDYAGLVRAAAGGDEGAMERLLMHAQEVAWRFSLTVCGHADDAEDAMQEALIKTYRHAGQIRDPDAFRPWLYRTVRNACLMGRRKKAHEPAHVESLDEPGPDESAGRDPADTGRSPEQLAGDSSLRMRLRRALLALPGPYRAIVFLREMEGLSTREVASVMGISEDNVKTRLHRARVALQAELGKDAR
jgi:RNA polymerase sigma-70 factor (ECF subfamily)